MWAVQRRRMCASCMLLLPLLAAVPAYAADRHVRTLLDMQMEVGPPGDRMPDAEGPEPMTMLSTPLSLALRDASAAEAEEVEVAPLQPLSVVFINGTEMLAAEEEYIMGRLLPAAVQVLGRSVRVRRPSGMLDFSSLGVVEVDGTDQMIPDPPDGAAGYDADLLVQVSIGPTVTCLSNELARAAARVFEQGTMRPVFGDMVICDFDDDPVQFNFDLAVMVHELVHILGMTERLFKSYPGYPDGFPVTRSRMGGSPPQTVVSSPQVTAYVREFFDCPDLAGAAFEDGEGFGVTPAHWESQRFDVRLMTADMGSRNSRRMHYNSPVLTDLTLALLQDTNWYDVIYGSSGFSSWGYKGGCAFARGTAEEVAADERGAQYLCTEESSLPFTFFGDCFHDHSGSGTCQTLSFASGIEVLTPTEAPKLAVDCQSSPGQRCLAPAIRTVTADPACLSMSCSAEGTVLVEDEPCDLTGKDCPDDFAMCDDPGFLTCVGEPLNDCNGRGDCFRGRCFCHLGWGGADCSEPLCMDMLGCDDGTPCPPSGFCGVPECGSFSIGSNDRGTPCNGGASFDADGPDASEDDHMAPFPTLAATGRFPFGPHTAAQPDATLSPGVGPAEPSSLPIDPATTPLLPVELPHLDGSPLSPASSADVGEPEELLGDPGNSPARETLAPVRAPRDRDRRRDRNSAPAGTPVEPAPGDEVPGAAQQDAPSQLPR
eukprot:jgi/Ulvmu1/4004/UM186_0004.1